MGTKYFRNWFHELNGNDDFRLPTKAQEDSMIEEVREKGKEKRDAGKEWRWDVGLYEEKVPFLAGEEEKEEEEEYETSVLIKDRNSTFLRE